MAFPKLVLVDLDGTLIDSVPDLAKAVDETLQALSLPPRGEAQVRHWVGNGIERLVKRALLGQLEGEPPTDLFDKALPIFKEYYGNYNGLYSRAYPGVTQGLDWLKTQKCHLACITNKATQFTLPLLEKLQLRSYFELVVCGDSLPKKKPDPLPLLHTCEHFNLSPAQALMVGDSVNDVQAARAAGFQVICVSYGYNHGQDIRLAEPDAVIDSMTELSEILTQLTA